MEGCLLDLAKNEVQSLVHLVKNEAQYFCCFNSYVENFDQNKKILVAKHKDVKNKFQRGKGVFNFKLEAQQWEHEANDIINIDAKIKKKFFFGWCPNCWWQYRRGRELEEKTKQIEKLLERCNSNIVASRVNVSDIKYRSSQDFIHFKSRVSKFEDLRKALQDDNCNMIGLQGMGGAGKTSMAKEVACELKDSTSINKVIFLVVSQPPDFKKIRDELAKDLDLDLEGVNEEEFSHRICYKITHMDEELLIILDDVWEKFDLTKNLGIPSDHQHKGCKLLITTRSLTVSTGMGCQTIELQTLNNEEASDLFKAHANINKSSRGLKGMPEKIVKHCGGVPIAIVAIARALRNQPTSIWKDALKTLEDCSVHQNLEEAYICLKLSYNNLKNEMANKLFLISSLFPEDFEISIELLTKIGIGLGSFGENDKYYLARREVDGAIKELIDFSLLLNGEQECLKMHDLVREVALWIGGKDILSIIDFKMNIKENLIRYLLWMNIDDIPDEFHGNKLEVLLIYLDGSKVLEVSDAFFKEMTRLKVLILSGKDFGTIIPAPSLPQSLQSLKDIQSLTLRYLELGDISIFVNLSSLVHLQLHTCSIIEFPSEFMKLKKLRSLEVESCEIKENNPFDVIERCLQLEELTFVGNECYAKRKDAISQNESPLALHRYRVCSTNPYNYLGKYDSMSRCFRVDDLTHLISDATFKHVVGIAELLILQGTYAETTWKNLIPDIVPIDKRSMMNDLITLRLSYEPKIQCLIEIENHNSNASAFSNLAELHLSVMGVEDLYRGDMPSGFLEQLEIMTLVQCQKLKNTLFNGNFKLHHLKSLEMKECPMLISMFQPSTARTLMQLENLIIEKCNALEFIITDISSGGETMTHCYDSLFPKLKTLQISGVPRLIGIYREHHQPMSSSLQKPSSPHSTNNSKKIIQNPVINAFSRVQACCFRNKSRATSEETNFTYSNKRLAHHTVPQELLDESMDGVPPFHAAQSLLVKSFKNVREIKLEGCENLISLSTLSAAASTMLLEKLTIRQCHKLKSITTHEEDDEVDKNYGSIFPRLGNLYIRDCRELELIFSSAISGALENLKSLTIVKVPKLKYIFGKYHQEQLSWYQNQNDELHLDLPTLKILYIEDAQKTSSICAKNYKLVLSALQKLTLKKCSIESLIDLTVCSDEEQMSWKTTEELQAPTNRDPPFHAAQSLSVQSLKNVRQIRLEKCWNLMSLSTLSISVEKLTIRECHKLKCITTSEGDDQVDKNYCSIFPRLEDLNIEDCNELELLFLSAVSGGLENLKSLTIKNVPKLKYLVGKYYVEQQSSHRNQNDEFHFNLPALETLDIYNAPKINSICAKNYKLVLSSLQKLVLSKCSIKSLIELTVFSDEEQINWKTAKELHASTYKDPLFHATQSFLVQPLKNVREIKLVECWNLISLSTLSIAASTISLEKLTIRECHKLKCITTNEGDDQVDKNYCSIFPRLENLYIEGCKELELLFLSAVARGLEKLKSLTIADVPKLKYVVDKYHEEQQSSYQNQNDELHFNLPALENIVLRNVPKFNDICAKNYKVVLSSLQNVNLRNFNIKSFTDYNMVNWRTTEELHESTDGAPLFHVAKSLLIQSLKNIRKMQLVECENLMSVSTLSIASTVLLEDLTIYGCHQLKCIAADEGDVGIHMNYNSIFPQLKHLRVSCCDALEYLFPAYAFWSPVHLKSLEIEGAPLLKYVFGGSQHEDSLTHEHQNIQTHLDFPALENLSIREVPELVSIYPKDYYLRGLSLKSFALHHFSEFTMRPFNEFLVCWHTNQYKETKAIEMHWQTLESLEIWDSKIEEIFSLRNTDTEKNGKGPEPLTSSLQWLYLNHLSELVNLCVGPKWIISFHHLQMLQINECRKLKVIFSASTMKSLPMLRSLEISKCEELAHIVEEDHETNVDNRLLHEPCFPKLENVYVKHCDKLKYLFSVTIYDILPNLRSLVIFEAYELEHVLIRRDEMKEMDMEVVLPQINDLRLNDLPNLVSVCHGIDFQSLEGNHWTIVCGCPNFSFYETITTQLQQYTSGSVSLTKGLQEATEEIVEEDFISEMATKTISSSDSKLTGQLKVPTHTSPYLTVLSTRYDTLASANFFEEEEEEEEGGLITSRRPGSGMKDGSSLLKEKLQNTINDDPFVRPVTIISSDQTSKAILLLSPMSSPKASTSLNQNKSSNEDAGVIATRRVIDLAECSSVYPRDSTRDDVQVSGKSLALAIVSSGSRNLVTIPPSTTSFEGVDKGDIKEASIESKSNVEPCYPTLMEQESSYSKDSQPRRAMTTPSATITQDESSKIVDVRAEEGASLETPHPSSLTSKKELNPDNRPNPTVLPKSPSTTTKNFEGQEEGGLMIITHGYQSEKKVASPLPAGKDHKTSNHGDPFVSPVPIISSEQASGTILPLSIISSPTSPKHTLMSTPSESIYGRNVQDNVGITNQPLHEGQPLECSSSEMAPTFYETNNDLSVPGVQDIVDMMKLDGVEASMLAKAFKTQPQLCLSTQYRSIELLCFSYRVLLNILSILATRSPFTITEADKRLLRKYLNDANVLGFDKDWLESIRTKVFNFDVSEVQRMQEVLKDLGNKLQTKKIELAIVNDQEAKAAQSTEMAKKELEAAQYYFIIAQQEHANARVRHSQILEECQEILEQRDQCWEAIAVKFRHFDI